MRWKSTLATLTLPSFFSDTAQYRQAFTQGDCGYFAIALANALGTDVATASVDTREAWLHAGVWLDDHHIIDIVGIYSVQDWLGAWEWAADYEGGYEDFGAYRWRAIEFLPTVFDVERYYPQISMDEAVNVVLANINS